MSRRIRFVRHIGSVLKFIRIVINTKWIFYDKFSEVVWKIQAKISCSFVIPVGRTDVRFNRNVYYLLLWQTRKPGAKTPKCWFTSKFNEKNYNRFVDWISKQSAANVLIKASSFLWWLSLWQRFGEIYFDIKYNIDKIYILYYAFDPWREWWVYTLYIPFVACTPQA